MIRFYILVSGAHEFFATQNECFDIPKAQCKMTRFTMAINFKNIKKSGKVIVKHG